MKNKLLAKNYNNKILGKHIYLKPISANDISEKYINWLNDPESNKYLEVRHKIQTESLVINYINNLRQIEGCDLFGIFIKSSEAIVGTLGITNYDKNNKRIEYGLLIGDKISRQMGIGGLATIMFYEYIFTYTDMQKIHNPVVDANKDAWQLVESLGSKREGVLRKHFLLSSGESRNMYLYGILKEDWIQSKKNIPLMNLKITIERLNK